MVDLLRMTKFQKIFKRYLVSSASIWLSTGRETDKFLIHYGAKEESL